VSIAGKIFCAFCAVLLVVLALGFWSLQATRRLHSLNQQLVTEGLAAVRIELALAQTVPLLMRHEARALVLRDSSYERLHQEASRDFQQQLERLILVLHDSALREGVADVERRFRDYRGLFESGITALQSGDRGRALRLSEGPGREAASGLMASIDALLAQSLVKLDRDVVAAGALERQARLATAGSMILSLAIGVLVAAFVARRIARPVRALCQATEAVAQGQYEVPLAVKGSDEIGELARGFQQMAGRLRELEQLRDNFFASLVHEFRSPLSSITMAANLLATGPIGEKQRRWIEIIQLDSHRLLRMTNELLEVSKLRAGAIELHLAPTDLQEIARAAAAELQPLLESKEVRLTVDFPEPIPRIVCDRWRMEQVVTNLLANAVRFTPAGGRIVMRAGVHDDGVVLSVEDTGEGIPADQLPHIFDRYRQAHGGRGGTGLGLTLVKAVVEAHGGRVWAESQEGSGTRVHCLLPAGAGALSA
jgi:two-component system, NtrC family, sensor histidine kinase GlrK